MNEKGTAAALASSGSASSASSASSGSTASATVQLGGQRFRLSGKRSPVEVRRVEEQVNQALERWRGQGCTPLESALLTALNLCIRVLEHEQEQHRTAERQAADQQRVEALLALLEQRDVFGDVYRPRTAEEMASPGRAVPSE